jgi:hypothetical protein
MMGAMPEGSFPNNGSSSLSGYILHSIILGSVFMGWALGLLGSLKSAVIMPVEFATSAAVVMLMNAWKTWFRYGPDELLLWSIVDLSWKASRNEQDATRTSRADFSHQLHALQACRPVASDDDMVMTHDAHGFRHVDHRAGHRDNDLAGSGSPDGT